MGSTEVIAKQFTEVLHQLLGGLAEVFPECTATAETLEQFEQLVLPFPHMQRNVMERWNAEMAPLEPLVEQAMATHDVSALRAEPLPDIIAKLRVWDKWEDAEFSGESRAALLEYVQQLNSYSRVGCNIPAGIMGSIDSTVRSMVASGGEPSVPDLMQASMQILNQASAEDLAALQASIPDLLSSLGSAAPGGGGPLQALQSLGGAGGMQGLLAAVAGVGPHAGGVARLQQRLADAEDV